MSSTSNINKRRNKNKYNEKISYRNTYDYSGCKSWWGYIVLDFELYKIVRVGGYGFYVHVNIPTSKYNYTHIINKNRIGNTAECRDYFFRDVDKVPDDYKFDDGEYKGWLQFRWGGGENAIDYVAPPKQNKPKIEIDEFNEYHDEIDDYKLIENKFDDLIDKEKQKI